MTRLVTHRPIHTSSLNLTCILNQSINQLINHLTPPGESRNDTAGNKDTHMHSSSLVYTLLHIDPLAPPHPLSLPPIHPLLPPLPLSPILPPLSLPLPLLATVVKPPQAKKIVSHPFTLTLTHPHSLTHTLSHIHPLIPPPPPLSLFLF